MQAICVLEKRFDFFADMWEELLKALPVAASSSVKFIFGPLGGYGLGLHLVTTIIATVVGMMASVTAFTFFGDWLRDKIVHRFFSKRKKFSQGNRRFVTIWKKYGLAGVAFLTPLLLTPIGGTILAVAFGSPKDRVLIYMFISGSVWATIFSVAIYTFGNNVLPAFVQQWQ
jgi:membrane protein DedA with SNARE-associated domain